MNVQILRAKPEMAESIIGNVRAEQVEFVSAKTELSKDLMAQILVSTHCFVGMADGKIAVVWGVLTPSITSGVGVVWALTTNVADEYPLVFARRSKIEIEKIKSGYSELMAYVDTKFGRSVKWLRWLGFDLSEPRQFHGMKARVAKMKGAI